MFRRWSDSPWQPCIFNECQCIKNKHIYLIVLGGAGLDESKKLQPNNNNNNKKFVYDYMEVDTIRLSILHLRNSVRFIYLFFCRTAQFSADVLPFIGNGNDEKRNNTNKIILIYFYFHRIEKKFEENCFSPNYSVAAMQTQWAQHPDDQIFSAGVHSPFVHSCFGLLISLISLPWSTSIQPNRTHLISQIYLIKYLFLPFTNANTRIRPISLFFNALEMIDDDERERK